MNMKELKDIQPYVRMTKIQKSISFEGDWQDIDHVIIYVVQGSFDYILEGVKYHMEEGSFLLIPPYLSHLAIKKNNAPLVQYIVHFDFYEDAGRMRIPYMSGKGGGTVSEKEDLLQGEHFFASIPYKERAGFETLFLTMYREFFGREEGRGLMLKGLATQMLVTLARSISVQEKTPGELTLKRTKSWKLVKNAMEYICLHYNEELDNLKISEAVGASPNYLSKLFRDYVGVSLHVYVLNYRLDMAQKMLRNGKYNVTEVALKCGFSSVHVFSKAFKQNRRTTPGAYMEMMKKDDMAILDKGIYDPDQMSLF